MKVITYILLMNLCFATAAASIAEIGLGHYSREPFVIFLLVGITVLCMITTACSHERWMSLSFGEKEVGK